MGNDKRCRAYSHGIEPILKFYWKEKLQKAQSSWKIDTTINKPDKMDCSATFELKGEKSEKKRKKEPLNPARTTLKWMYWLK